ncbi:YafY family protein [Cellulomonas cellasea]|uniref:Putative DNA-binding transcriptional regulator YafY n=1 Tax=Cellulomonas cellasea TaxID=43670 RepID=A0A7W4YCP5_9CELL|nr:WYL domain-containing protein [Cellulomonas cellasea]MBB2924339.1 putative DNA-binding transcriptional regulator YafY [Cellulomonas cellasea]
MTADESPTARALLTLELLQDAPGVTADRLAARLGVSERAARRYVGILREAGIPVESVRGPYGGYRIGRGLRAAPLRFTDAEALALVMAVLDGHHDADDPADPVGQALDKILRALPGPVAAQATAVRRTAAAAPDRAAARPDPATASALVHACADRRPVRIGYRSEAGNAWDAEVDPWAVVVRHGRWYLVCRLHRADAVRAYRVDRVGAVEVLPGTFTPPDDLDPVVLLDEHLATGWEYTADVVIEEPVAGVRRRLPRALGRLEALDDATTRLTGTTSNPYWYAEQLAVLPVPFRVLGGPELRATVGALARRLRAAVPEDDAVPDEAAAPAPAPDATPEHGAPPAGHDDAGPGTVVDDDPGTGAAVRAQDVR